MKSQLFSAPFTQKSVAEAVRSFASVANKEGSQISDYPNDFRLYRIAEFDEESGRVTPLADPQDLGAAADFQKKKS